MATPTDQDLLDAVLEALSGTLSRKASQYTIGGRSITALSIKDLLALRQDLERRIATAAATNRPLVPRFRRPG